MIKVSIFLLKPYLFPIKIKLSNNHHIGTTLINYNKKQTLSALLVNNVINMNLIINSFCIFLMSLRKHNSIQIDIFSFKHSTFIKITASFIVNNKDIIHRKSHL